MSSRSQLRKRTVGTTGSARRCLETIEDQISGSAYTRAPYRGRGRGRGGEELINHKLSELVCSDIVDFIREQLFCP